ncbi:MAG: VWA domain-containing protein [Actinomycetota bacterium]|nr:VWA domain-containing protein [Actinomycetota bacterium]
METRDFPLISVTVTTDQTASVNATDVRVLENGVPVRVVSVGPLGGTGQKVDVVLAIDVSNSMQGGELRTALAAARAFVLGVPDSLPIGILSFAQEPMVRAPVTDDRASVKLAVDSLGTMTIQGTALYEAVVTGSGMFDPTSRAQHNLILLTDGKNTAGTADVAQAIQAARGSRVTVYAIALAGSDADEGVLRQLAVRTGGRFQSITSDDLQAVYSGLALELSQQLVVTYRSKAPYGAPVALDVQLPFGTASTRFLTPGQANLTGQDSTQAEQTPKGSVGTSDAAIAFIAGLAFLAFLNLVLLLQSLTERRRRETQLRSRLIADVSTDRSPEAEGPQSNPWIPQVIADLAERTAGGTRAGSTLTHRLGQAGWSLRVGEFLALVIFVGIATAVGGFLLFGLPGTLVGVAGLVAPLVMLSAAAAKRLAAIQEQLADTLMVIASSLRAGHSFLQSLDTATKEISEPGASEFGRTMSELRFGRDVDEALDSLVDRIGSRDLEWTVTAIKIQRKIGGNLAEVLEGVAKTIRERQTLRRQVRVLSAEGRISSYVLTALPILLGTYLTFVNPDYLRVLTSTRAGIMMLSAAGGLMVVGYLWMQKIVRLDDV